MLLIAIRVDVTHMNQIDLIMAVSAYSGKIKRTAFRVPAGLPLGHRVNCRSQTFPKAPIV
jgi:hypothetical protein